MQPCSLLCDKMAESGRGDGPVCAYKLWLFGRATCTIQALHASFRMQHGQRRVKVFDVNLFDAPPDCKPAAVREDQAKAT